MRMKDEMRMMMCLGVSGTQGGSRALDGGQGLKEFWVMILNYYRYLILFH